MLLQKKNSTNSFYLWAGKPRPYTLLILLPLFLFSCSKDYSKYAKLSRYNTNDKNSFIFTVDEEFVRDHQKSKQDENYPRMSEAEVKLIKSFFYKQKFCINQEGRPAFEITSKQEKIYDITFSHLIEQNYNAKPVTPRTYFGHCLDTTN